MKTKTVISLSTGLEDAEKVTVAFLVAVGSAETERPTLMFLAKEAVRLVVGDVASGTACEGCPPLEDLIRRYAEAGAASWFARSASNPSTSTRKTFLPARNSVARSRCGDGSAMNQPTRSAIDRSLVARLAHAITAKDGGELRALFSTPVIFRGATPRRFWEAENSVGVSDIVLGTWFGTDKAITEVISIQAATVGDVMKVSYRMAVDLESGTSVIEQVADYSEQDGKITQMRLACSGFRPAAP